MSRRILIEFLGQDKNLGKTMTDVNAKTSKLSSGMQKAGAVAGKALVGGAVLAAGGLYKMGQAAAEDETAANKLSLALKKNAKATDAQVASTEDWITAQGKALGISDDQLRPALTKLVGATKDIGEAQKLTTLAMDISAGSGKSLEQVTTALTRAQNGSVSSLSRLGIKVQDSEKDAVALKAAQIAQTKAQQAYNQALKEFGAGSQEARNAANDLEYRQMKLGEATGKVKKSTIDFTEAQKRLTDQYGGQAAKAADTTAGKQKILQVQLSELGETIGYKVLPVMVKLSEIGLKMVGWISKNTTTVGILVAALAGLAATVWAVGAAIKAWEAITKVWTAVTKIATAVQWAMNAALEANPIGLVVLALVALTAGLVIAYKKSETFRKIVNGAFGAVKKFAVAAFHKVMDAAHAVFGWLKKNWPYLLGVLAGPFGLAAAAIYKNWDKVKAATRVVKDFVVDRFNGIVDFFKKMPSRISHAVSGMFDGIKEAFRAAINWIIEKWNNLAFSIPGVNTHIPGVGTVGGFTLGTPNIPYLAKGGIVTRPTLAMLGERGPEAVVPLSSRRAGGFGGDDRPILVQFVLDGRVIEESLIRRNRTTGRPLQVKTISS